jgi:Pentapeptide repeats (8 copies)
MGVNLTCANMTRTRLPAANLSGANLSGADLTDADLGGVSLIEANLEMANLTGCSIYGLSAWNVKLEGAKQLNLVITRQDEAVIQVDNLEVAQFIYLLLNNKKIREVIDTIISKVVLILGRFTPSRKVILDRLREKLRADNYLPILFDFEKPTSRTTVETITTLAHMSCLQMTS